MKYDWTKFLEKTRVVKSSTVFTAKVIKGFYDPHEKIPSGVLHAGPGEMLLDEARVYVPDAKIGHEITLPTLWYFYFPKIGETEEEEMLLPVMMGEHGHTLEEATERVVARLEDYIANPPPKGEG